jgi:hypothetical protein
VYENTYDTTYRTSNSTYITTHAQLHFTLTQNRFVLKRRFLFFHKMTILTFV